MSLSVPAHLHNIHDLSPTVGELTDHNDVILELPFALEVDDDLDMRHLDLAVSEYNIDSLTHTSYFNTPASDAPYFNTPVAGAHNNPAFYNTIPLQYSHEPRCDNRSRSHDFIGLDDDVYNGILTSTPGANDAVSVTNSAMVSEQDIDTLYYKVTTHCSNAKVSLRHSSRSETTV
uniref:Uncharacterized protein n=1 Tax=Ciona savignyi TaxID=51511 RepID=H2ZP28_CIOSA